MIRTISKLIISHRYLLLGIIVLVTLFFLWQIGKITIESRFSDLLPQNHPYIKIHNKYKDH
jgi:predicted RND superfamily exporter protein